MLHVQINFFRRIFNYFKNFVSRSRKFVVDNLFDADFEFRHYELFSKYYNVFEQHLNQEGKGIKKGWASYKIPIDDIVSGKKNPNYSRATLKRRLIDEGYAEECCSVCGFNEGRVTDNKIPLYLDFIDGNSDLGVHVWIF